MGKHSAERNRRLAQPKISATEFEKTLNARALAVGLPKGSSLEAILAKECSIIDQAQKDAVIMANQLHRRRLPQSARFRS